MTPFLFSTNQPTLPAGYFLTGVNCASKTTSQVIGIRFNGPVDGVANCAKVQNNTFAGGNYAEYVYPSGIANSDSFSDNYVKDQAAVYYYGTKAIEVSHNVIVNTTTDDFAAITIGPDASGIHVLSNIFMGSHGTPVTDSSFGGTYSTNICDPNNTSFYGCGYCQSQGWCQDTGTPYSGL